MYNLQSSQRLFQRCLFLLGFLFVALPLIAQNSNISGKALDNINVRSGPSNDYPVLATLPINAAVVIEGRNQVGDRLLINGNGIRGWVASRYISWSEEIELGSIVVTSEVVGGAAAPTAAPANTTTTTTTSSSAPLPSGGTSARIIADKLNLRTGPDGTYASLGQLAIRTQVVIEGRNQIGNWLLVNTGSLRGWVASRFVSWDSSIELATFPVTGEIIGGTTVAAANPAATAAPAANNAVAPAGARGKVIAATLNIRIGASSSQTQIGTMNRGATVTIEARNQIGDWVIVNNGTVRGWAASRFIDFNDDVVLANLPVSAEVIGQTPPPAAAGGAAPALAVSGDTAALEAQLAGVPIVGSTTARARQLYANALRAGRNPYRFTKVGDCNSENLAFMYGFDWNNYSLGQYGYLQSTVDYFSGSFAQTSIAGKVGYSAVTVIDATWADANLCRKGEAPVYCELRVSNAAFVVIMFGANDISILTPQRYEQAMRRILDLSIQANAVPILSTFTTDPAQPDRWLKSLQLNLITVNLAREYDLPIMNFWLAAKNLPSAGMSSDNAHLTTHSGSSIVFDGSENTFGFTMRNLVVMQTLDVLRRDLAGG